MCGTSVSWRTPRSRATAAAVLLMALLPACTFGGTTSGDGRDVVSVVRADLAEAEGSWSADPAAGYRLEVVEVVNHWTRGCRWSTLVQDGVVVQRSVVAGAQPTCLDRDWTVEVLFAQISTWADEVNLFRDPVFGEHVLVAEFSEIGVPIAIDYDLANGFDEESSLRIEFSVVESP